MDDRTKLLLERLKTPKIAFGESPLDRLNNRNAAPIVADPLADIAYTGNAEEDSKLEISATLQAFKDRAKAEEKRRADATDSEFWVAVVFQTRAQKEEFLAKVGMPPDEDKYLDGQKFAAKLGIDLLPADVSYRDARIDKTWAAMAEPLP